MLNNIYELNFTIELLTGLHIGGSSDVFDIGGADSTVIKNPLTNEPYIPGSSIKGKIRSLLTYCNGAVNEKDNDIVIGDQDILNLFEAVEREDRRIAISRAIFRDSYLTKESKELLTKRLGEGVYTEIKAENKINPITGTAANPRLIERVPAGTKFEAQIVLQVFDGDDAEKMKKTLEKALELLESNYLGGNGTRGYGRVKISHNGFTSVNI